MLRTVWHQISGKHMGRSLREVEFRWQHRIGFEDRLSRLFRNSAGRLPVKGLLA